MVQLVLQQEIAFNFQVLREGAYINVILCGERIIGGQQCFKLCRLARPLHHLFKAGAELHLLHVFTSQVTNTVAGQQGFHLGKSQELFYMIRIIHLMGIELVQDLLVYPLHLFRIL